MNDIDFRNAFELAPIGLALSRGRLIANCNRELLAMFGAKREQVVGQSFKVLYPSATDYDHMMERIAASLSPDGHYAGGRVMKRLDTCDCEGLFWCHISGQVISGNVLSPVEIETAVSIWAFENMSEKSRREAAPTRREREIALLLIEGMTSKVIGKRLNISPRTVDVHRARLMHKYEAATTQELVRKLLGA